MHASPFVASRLRRRGFNVTDITLIDSVSGMTQPIAVDVPLGQVWIKGNDESPQAPDSDHFAVIVRVTFSDSFPI